MMELACKVESVLPEQRFSGRNGEVVKNAFVVSWMEGQYEQKLCLEVIGADKFEKMKSAVVAGNEVLVKFGVSSREYKSKWYTTCTCWYCAAVGGSRQSSAQAAETKTKAEVKDEDDGNSLPF